MQLSTRVTRIKPDPITITQAAADRVKELIENKDGSAGVIIGVKRRGCNGMSYTLNYANPSDIKDSKFEMVTTYGVNVLVEPSAIFAIVGSEMDFVETELTTEFVFKNPNSKSECGCKESFNI